MGGGNRCWKDIGIEMLLVKMDLCLGLKTAEAFQKVEGNWKTLNCFTPPVSAINEIDSVSISEMILGS